MKSNEEILSSIFTRLDNMSYIKTSEIPEIDLYMDQVTTFMDEHLKSNKRYPEDKALTKTMINNYAKNHLLPSPLKKKYSKEHMLILILIYYYKNLISLTDIETLFAPLSDKHFSGLTDDHLSLEEIYNDVFDMSKSSISDIKTELKNMYAKSESEYSSSTESDKEYLILFSFVCQLAFDIYVKKQMMESIIDYMNEDNIKNNKKQKKDKA